MLLQLRPTPGPLASALSFLTRRSGRAGVADLCAHSGRAEEREETFRRVSDLARTHGLHIAPSVALGAVFSVRDGRRSAVSQAARSALFQERVDMLLLDRGARPVLAIDHCPPDATGRGAPGRNRVKSRLFDRAGLPIVTLQGLAKWDRDRGRIELRLADAETAERQER